MLLGLTLALQRKSPLKLLLQVPDRNCRMLVGRCMPVHVRHGGNDLADDLPVCRETDCVLIIPTPRSGGKVGRAHKGCLCGHNYRTVVWSQLPRVDLRHDLREDPTSLPTLRNGNKVWPGVPTVAFLCVGPVLTRMVLLVGGRHPSFSFLQELMKEGACCVLDLLTKGRDAVRHNSANRGIHVASNYTLVLPNMIPAKLQSLGHPLRNDMRLSAAMRCMQADKEYAGSPMREAEEEPSRAGVMNKNVCRREPDLNFTPTHDDSVSFEPPLSAVGARQTS